MRPYIAGALLWGIFLVSWYAAMLWTARAEKQTSRVSRWRDFLFYAIGFGLLFSSRGRYSLWDAPVGFGYALVAVELASFAFAWWARIHIGRLWSGMIVLREGHHVVKTGPYRLVRHPIYTGFIGGSWAFALLAASLAPLVGAAILTAQMAWKATREEEFLRAELGREEYDSYAATTPMLIPFI